MDRFNHVFQKSTEYTTCMLYSETCRLLKLYAANLLESHVILAAGDNFRNLNLNQSGYLSDKNLGIGTATWACLAELEATHDLKPFLHCCEEVLCRNNQEDAKEVPL